VNKKVYSTIKGPVKKGKNTKFGEGGVAYVEEYDVGRQWGKRMPLFLSGGRARNTKEKGKGEVLRESESRGKEFPNVVCSETSRERRPWALSVRNKTSGKGKREGTGLGLLRREKRKGGI